MKKNKDNSQIQDLSTAWVAPGFEAVQAEFEQILQEPHELGSAVSVYWHGKPIVDLWGGFTTPKRRALWSQRSVASLFSVTKSLTALCLLHLIDQGKAQLDDKVITYWPEFDRGDVEKRHVTLRHLLTHQSGLPVIKGGRPGDVFYWDRMVTALEDAPLLWPSGTRLAYHAITFGHLVGEVIHRISGVMPSVYFANHFAEPLGLNLSVKLMPAQPADLTLASGNSWKMRILRTVLSYYIKPSASWHSYYYRPISSAYHPNSQIWQNSEIPAITGFGTAHGLARLYAMLAEGGCLDGHRIFSKEMADLIAQEQCPIKMDEGFKKEMKMGLGVYFQHDKDLSLGPNPHNFGHTGMGGATAFVDPDQKIGFGYLCNHLYQPTAESSSMIGERAIRLIAKLYECLAQQKR